MYKNQLMQQQQQQPLDQQTDPEEIDLPYWIAVEPKHFEIEAEDRERAKKFYSEAFGWELQQTGEEMGNYVVVKTGPENEPGGINGGIFTNPPGASTKLNAYSCVISVEDIDKSIEDVKQAGGKVIGEKMDIPTVGTYIKCIDTEGNNFSLLQPSMDAPQGT